MLAKFYFTLVTMHVAEKTNVASLPVSNCSSDPDYCFHNSMELRIYSLKGKIEAR
jgi:hypothetical protein